MISVIRAEERVTSAPGPVFQAIAEYEGFPAWCPEIRSARVLAREGDVAIVEVRTAAHPERPLVLEVVATPGTSVMFTQVDRNRRRGLSGRFDVAPERAGSSVRGELAFGTLLPNPWRRRRLRSVLADTLRALARHCSAETAEAPGLDEVTLLEVVRTTDGIEVRVGGERLKVRGARP